MIRRKAGDVGDRASGNGSVKWCRDQRTRSCHCSIAVLIRSPKTLFTTVQMRSSISSESAKSWRCAVNRSGGEAIGVACAIGRERRELRRGTRSPAVVAAVYRMLNRILTAGMSTKHSFGVTATSCFSPLEMKQPRRTNTSSRSATRFRRAGRARHRYYFKRGRRAPNRDVVSKAHSSPPPHCSLMNRSG